MGKVLDNCQESALQQYINSNAEILKGEISIWKWIHKHNVYKKSESPDGSAKAVNCMGWIRYFGSQQLPNEYTKLMSDDQDGPRGL